jgi:recombination protein RecA
MLYGILYHVASVKAIQSGSRVIIAIGRNINMAKSKAKSSEKKTIDPLGKDGVEKTKKEMFEEAIQNMKKTYGDGSIMKFGDPDAEEIVTKVDVIPTGILPVDRVTRVGGIPRGRITEVYGPEMSGKTTLCLHVINQCQIRGGMAVYIDMEHALESTHLKNLDINTLEISQPDTAEEALGIAEDSARSGVVDIVVIDSVAALVPRAEIEGDMGDSHMGLQARLMSQAMRKLTGAIAKSNMAIIFINQIRHKIGVMFGSPETTTGGNALKFYSSLRLDMRKIEVLKSGSDAYANKVRVKAVKNKVGVPFAVEEFTLYYDAKKTIASGIVELGSKLGIIDKSGTWYSYKGERIGQGVANTTDFFIANPNLQEEVASICRDPKVLNMKLASSEQQDIM